LFHGSETILSVSKTCGDKFGKKINDYTGSLEIIVCFSNFRLLSFVTFRSNKSILSILKYIKVYLSAFLPFKLQNRTQECMTCMHIYVYVYMHACMHDINLNCKCG
jgi:hypothetical protein